MSVSWNASVPMTAFGTCAEMTMIGIESMYAVAMPVMALVAPGPGRHQHDARLAGGARIAVRHVRGGLLVAHEDVFQALLLEDGIVDVQRGAAGIAEDVVDAFVLQGANQHLAAG